MPTETEIAWLAGLLEGEGYFRTQPQRPTGQRPRLFVELGMCDRDVVEKAASMFPTRTKLYIDVPTNPKWRPLYRKIWSGSDAERVMCAVLPYMGQRRATVIMQCIATPNLGHRPREVMT